jgi:hypothetical protein
MDLIKEGRAVIMEVQGKVKKVQHRMKNLGSVVNKLKNSHGHLVGDYLYKDMKVRRACIFQIGRAQPFGALFLFRVFSNESFVHSIVSRMYSLLSTFMTFLY